MTMYHLNDPPVIANASYYLFGFGLTLALIAATLRSCYRARPFERTCWFFGTVVYWIAASAINVHTRRADPRVDGFGAAIWCVAFLAFFMGLFQKPSLDPRVRCTKVADFFLATVCIAVFFAQLLPSMVHPPEAQAWSYCRNNLKQIMLAHHNDHEKRHRFVAASEEDPPRSWRVELLPWLDQKPVFDRYRFAATWDSAENLPIATTPMEIFQCPARKLFAGKESLHDQWQRYFSHYARVTGAHTAGGAIPARDITDGTSNTGMVVEACGVDRVWTNPVDVDIDSQPIGINLPSDRRFQSPGWISSHHSGGAHIAMADGSVRFVNEKIDPKLLKALVTIDGGEPVGDF